MTNLFGFSIIWVIAASILGFSISALFSGWLKLSRRVFLIPYVLLAGVFLYAYALWSEVNFVELVAKNWIAGVAAGVFIGIFLVVTVRSQHKSRQSHGGELLLDLIWVGLVYGMIDALFLNVLPVLAIWHGLSDFSWASSLLGEIAVGALALIASLLVTISYHLGYSEFRNRKMALVLFGNTLITLAYLFSNNPLGALISHPMMHVAAVVQGPETTIQLPPHTAPHR